VEINGIFVIAAFAEKADADIGSRGAWVFCVTIAVEQIDT